MAHCAEILQDGVVKRVIVVNEMYDNLTCEQWCEKTYGGKWIKTSYNTYGGVHYGQKASGDSLVYVPDGGTPLRKNFAAVGGTYDKNRDAFIHPKIHPSWKLNEETCQWEAPTPKPKDGKIYDWNEASQIWVERGTP